MPINYSKYPPNWASEIRPRILARANNLCEWCGLENKSLVWSVKDKGKVAGWFVESDQVSEFMETNGIKQTCVIKSNGKTIINPKVVKVILTVAHLDHDEYNHNVTDDRLKALCQLCHLRYDVNEKIKRHEK